MKKVFLLICLAAFVCLVVGCEDITKSTFTFVNNSSRRVTVSPNGQTSWSRFIFDPGQTHKIKIKESRIYYVYSPSNKVKVSSGSGTSTFTNN